MSYSVISISRFDRQAKRLSKKHPSLKQDLAVLFSSLRQEPIQGTPIGNNCYKIRLSIKSKAKGKSGGARIITHVYVTETTVFLLAIYDKSEQGSISDKEIKELLKLIR